MSLSYWSALEQLLTTSILKIDRPRGQPHPRYPELIYPLDYGFLDGTIAGDGSGIDVWVGSLNTRKLTGILCTFDKVKLDAEIKLLCSCNMQDIDKILQFYDELMPHIYIPNPEVNK